MHDITTKQDLDGVIERKAADMVDEAAKIVSNGFRVKGKLEAYILDHHINEGRYACTATGEDTGLPFIVKTYFHSSKDNKAEMGFKCEEGALRILQESGEHENIILSREIFETAEGRYIVFPRLSGKSLSAKIEEDEYVSLEDALQIVSDICDGLEYIHRAGIIHQDIKPENMYVEHPSGNIRVLDFNCALHEGTQDYKKEGWRFGTPVYMAPEIHDNLEFDHRVDIYSLGITIYEILTRERPFSGSSKPRLLVKIFNAEPYDIRSMRTDISQEVADVVHRAFAKDPSERHQSAAELKHAFAEAVRG